MAILTYKEAAKALKMSLTKFTTYIERPEYSEFRCEAQTNHERCGIIYSSRCRGVYFTENFIKLFNKSAERTERTRK